MNSSSKTNQLGFTLIEILLYLTLSSIMVALIGGIGVNVLSGLTNAKAEEDLQYNAQFVIEKVRTYILAADIIGNPEVGEKPIVVSTLRPAFTAVTLAPLPI